MDMIAHGLWTAAATIGANRRAGAGIRPAWAVWWGIFPDVLAFGPMVAVGLWMRLTNNSPDHGLRHFHIGLPLYDAGHSLLVCLAVIGVVSLLSRRIVYAMLGWLLHILIDIPTHSLSYYATRFLWPVSDFRVDGIPWWRPWFWAATYAALAIVYFLLWRKGWLMARKPSRTGADT